MNKIRVGNKQNSFINGQWAGHVRGWWKRFTSSKRRMKDKKVIIKELQSYNNDKYKILGVEFILFKSKVYSNLVHNIISQLGG